MRIYDGSPRQDFEEVLRSIGAFLDARGMKDILLAEVPDGFIVQGLVTAGSTSGAWSDTIGTVTKETLSFLDDDIAKFMDEGVARRGRGAPEGPNAGVHERALRVIGHWMDGQHPRDVFLFEQDGAYVVRLHIAGQAGSHHMLAEFTRDDVQGLVASAPSQRGRPAAAAGAASPAPGTPPPAAPPATPPDPGWGGSTG
ncbi:MAG TPA: hypothetical protein VFY23_00425 [Candidatus Limnocylindrales bacterium]|nr:hypothetical protein [Candidatus Limnocylindrales bacterium]